jgi:hypothetical protein
VAVAVKVPLELTHQVRQQVEHLAVMASILIAAGVRQQELVKTFQELIGLLVAVVAVVIRQQQEA